MDQFIDHALAWVQGELFEGLVFGVFGLMLLLAALLLWKFGSTANAQALIWPLALPATLLILAAAVGGYNNLQRKEAFQTAYSQDAPRFVQQEYERVQAFMPWYRYTVATALVLCLLGLGGVVFAGRIHWQAWGFSLLLLGFSGLMIDFFSKERAETYLQHILHYQQL